MTALLALVALVQEPADEELLADVRALGSKYKAERESARERLSGAGERARKFLEAGIESGDRRVRLGSIELLRRLGAPWLADRIGRIFQGTQDEETRNAAFDYLKQADAPAERFLLSALEIKGSRFRKEALEALAKLKSKEGAARAAALYAPDEPLPIRDAALNLVQEAGASEFAARFAADPEAGIRGKAIEAMGRSYDAPTVEVVGSLLKAEADEGVITKAFRYLEGAPGAAVERQVIEALDGPSDQTRILAIQWLARHKCERAFDKVMASVRSASDKNLKEAAIAYASVFSERAWTFLLGLLSDSDSEIRAKVLSGLGGCRSDEARERILAAYRKDPDKIVRRTALSLLLGFGPACKSLLVEGLRDPDADIRSECFQRAPGLGEEAVEPLLAAIGKNASPEDREKCAEALAQIGAKAIQTALDRAALDPALQGVARRAQDRYDDGLVSRVLTGRIMNKEITAAFEDRFEELDALPIGPARVTEALIRLHSPDPRAVSVDPVAMARLATLALGRLKGERARKFLADRFEELLGTEGIGLAAEAGVALHRAGDKDAIRRLTERLQACAESGSSDQLFTLAAVKNQLGDFAGALAAYEKLRILAAKPGSTVRADRIEYNIACAHARMGNRAKAVGALRSAVAQGFKFREWIVQDPDLDSIRQEPGYLELLSDDKAFAE